MFDIKLRCGGATLAQYGDPQGIEALRRAVADVRAAGWAPANVDCTVVLDRPKLAPVKAELERNLSEAVGAPVTVKGKRSEGIGALGRGEGALCLAVALVVASSEEAP